MASSSLITAAAAAGSMGGALRSSSSGVRHSLTGGAVSTDSSSSSSASNVTGSSIAGAPGGGFVSSSFFSFSQPFWGGAAGLLPPPPLVAVSPAGAVPPEQQHEPAVSSASADREEQQLLLQLFSDFTRRDWLQRMSDVNVYERDMNRLILNFFTVHGYEEAAEEFSKETGMHPDMPVAAIARRSQIKKAILQGRMEEAIRLIDLVHPNILALNPEVNFLLKQQQLLHLIEKGDTCAAIEFAQQQLAPCVKQHPDLLPKLEEAMALLAFSDLKCGEAQRLLGGMDQREQTARRIDEAILDFFSIEQESALESLAKNVVWTQKQIQKRLPGACPLVADIATGAMIVPSTNNEGGSSNMKATTAAENITNRRTSSSSMQERGHIAQSSSSSRGHLRSSAATAEEGESGISEGESAAGARSAALPPAGSSSSSSSSTAAATSGSVIARSASRVAIRSGPPSMMSLRRTYHSERGRREVERRRREAS